MSGYTTWTKNNNHYSHLFLPEYRLYDSLEQHVHLHSKGALLFSFRSYCMRALNQLLHFGVLEWDCEWSYNKPISLVRLKCSPSSFLDTEKWWLRGQEGCPENPGTQPQAEVALTFLTICYCTLLPHGLFWRATWLWMTSMVQAQRDFTCNSAFGIHSVYLYPTALYIAKISTTHDNHKQTIKQCFIGAMAPGPQTICAATCVPL